ncbi:hypothetical protein LMH87_000956 [Akanthomyces muscarius]|uniref:Uncharacterized protein n=1 Tax=Akanthomyces muscarius TaxID=2231603 RepID=A0A9W8UN17_AKAMU|nr:hypothetical protein LMH87_000956 [Akanthomyces muscarius]KAJ4155722.1 hypothetical protein LMH87_000956 [Akanthomyces muscarius]
MGNIACRMTEANAFAGTPRRCAPKQPRGVVCRGWLLTVWALPKADASGQIQESVHEAGQSLLIVPFCVPDLSSLFQLVRFRTPYFCLWCFRSVYPPREATNSGDSENDAETDRARAQANKTARQYTTRTYH